MTTDVPPVPTTPQDLPDQSEQLTTESVRGLMLRLRRPTSTAVVVHVVGALDAATAPRLEQLLVPRLASTAQTVILDLSGLEFLGVAGLELLAQARRRAASRATTLSLVDGPVCVERALRAAGWRDSIPSYPTVAAAVAELTGRPRDNPAEVLS